MPPRPLSFMLALGTLSILFLANTACEAEADSPLRVLTFNVKVDFEVDASCPPWDLRKDFCAQVVQEARADVIGFQETSANQLAFFEAALPGYGVSGDIALTPEEQDYFISRFPPLKEIGIGAYTDAILMYRADVFDKVDEGHWWQSPTPGEVSTGFGNVFPRIAVWARLKHKASGQDILVAVTHFDNTAPAQQHMAALSHDKLKPFIDEGLPILFLGDFNSGATTEAYGVLTSGGWQDSYTASPEASPGGRDNNVPTIGGSARIDHIFYHGEALQADTWQRLESPDPKSALSDHYPVLATLKFNPTPPAVAFQKLSLATYRDKMAGAWIGQMAGVGWGFPTEFEYLSEIIPADKMPVWTPETVNQFDQDDLYVEMTFLKSLETYGFDVSSRQAGIDYANSEYQLWHANGQARKNLRAGIAPPDSGHPEFTKHADDIDYQIEADFAGLIGPGMPNLGIALGEKFGCIMNYGDGIYGGQFMSGMYADAFFESDIAGIIQAGLRCIPPESQYAECIRDVVAWHPQYPEDWEKVWGLLQAKYHEAPEGRRFVCKASEKGNIDAKLNGAYAVMGLLFGAGDLDQTIIIATRCGQDSDCNPASAAGILGTVLGRAKLPEKFTSALNSEGVFSHSAYSFTSLLETCEALARQAIVRAGGTIEKDATGQETIVIPVVAAQPSKFVQSWKAEPSTGSRYTDEEMKQITATD